MRSTAPWIAGGAGLAALGVAWAYTRSRQQAEVATVDVQTALAALVAIPYRSRKWSQTVARIAVDTAPSGVDPVTWGQVLLGKLDRESWGGDALRPTGAAGTGDWTARTLDRLRRVAPALESQVRISADVPAGWITPKNTDGSVVPGPYVIPGDGLGWGRGLAQLDWMSQPFARTGPWQDAETNLRQGAAFLAGLYKTLTPWLATNVPAGTVSPMRVAVAAYNAGPSAVKAAVLAGRDPDTVTTGRDYSIDVLRRGAVVA